MRKRYILFMVLIFGLVSMLLPHSVPAAKDNADLDVVLVLDVSGSMKTTDEKRVAFEGAKLFLDMMESAKSRAGFVAFDSKVIQKYDLTALNSADNKSKLKNAINQLEYARGDTNIGLALDTALQMLDGEENTENKKMILFFTDGNIDLDNRPSVESDAEKESLRLSKETSKKAAEEGISIYTIGLNAGKSEKFQMDPTLITEIAKSTDSLCRIVASADELPAAFNDIFADIIDSEIDDLGEVTISVPDAFEEKKVQIPNESVLEANVIMITGDSGQLDEIQILDPDGQMVDPDGENAILTSSTAYHMLKLLVPKAGEWTLRMKGNPGCKVHVNLIFNYDITMEVSTEEDSSGEVIHVSAWLLKKGLILTDQAIYDQLTAVATAVSSDGTETSYPMELNDKNIYFCDVPLSEGQTVNIRVHIEGANMYRDFEGAQYSREASVDPETEEEMGEEQDSVDENNPEEGQLEETKFSVTVNAFPSSMVLKGLLPNMCKEILDLSDYFTSDDTEAANLTYRVTADNKEIVDTELEDGKLNLSGKSEGSTSIEITATDANGEEYIAETEVQVDSVFANLMLPVLICVGVLAVLFILIGIIMKKR